VSWRRCSRVIIHVAKSRRGRVRLKLRPWMADPLVVKDADASIRLATDLPRFNWLEVKLNKKLEATNSSNVTCSNQAINPVPFQIRVLDQSASELRQLPDFKVEEKIPAQTMCTSSKWPLKKRIIRPQEGSSALTNTQSIKDEPPPANSSTALPHISNCLADGVGGRAPVIVSHVMPPTPPSSSAPAEALVNEVQDKPLDLSKQRYRRADEEETTADVEIISMTTQIQTPNRPSTVASHRYPAHPIAPSQASLKSVTQSRSIRDTNPTQQILRSSGIVPIEWNRSSSFRSVHPSSDRTSQQPVVLPNFRPHPYQGRGQYSQAQRNGTHSEVQMVNSSGSFSPRYFHPQQITGIKKPIAPLAPIPSTTIHPPTTHHGLVRSQNHMDWSIQNCIVCSRRAGFRCAGCHAKAYCSSICQAVDWSWHSQLCQQTS